MEQGLRVVGTVEFGGLNNPLSKSRIKNLINNAKYMLGDLPEHEDEWLGFRPTLPDFLPVMGPSKNYKNVFYCFGHHHLGWTLGPISGKIVSGMIAKENTNLNLDPYSSKDLVNKMQNTKAYIMLVCATLFWAGNFMVGKFAFLENIPPMTLVIFRWSLFGLYYYHSHIKSD